MRTAEADRLAVVVSSGEQLLQFHAHLIVAVWCRERKDARDVHMPTVGRPGRAGVSIGRRRRIGVSFN